MAGELKRYLEFFAQSQEFKAAASKILNAEVTVFAALLSTAVAHYYTLYTPIVYKRTMRFLDSVRIDTKAESTDGGFSMRVYFDQAAGNHPSLFGKGDGFVPILLNQGWSWKDDTIAKHGNHYHFSFYPHDATYNDYLSNDAAMKSQGQGHWQFVELAIEQYFKLRGPKALPILKVVTANGEEKERTPFNP